MSDNHLDFMAVLMTNDREEARLMRRVIEYFPKALIEIGKTLEEGDETHPEQDWREHEPCYSCASLSTVSLRHASHVECHASAAMCERTDEDHLAHGATRALMALETRGDGE